MNSSIARSVGFLLRITDGLSLGLFCVAGVLVAGQALIISYEVTVRYLFNRPTTWVMDFSEYALVYSTFMAAPWLLKIGGHISVSALADRLTGGPRHVLDAVGAILAIIVCCILGYNGIDDTLDAYRLDMVIARPIIVPKFLILWVIPFGFILLLPSLLSKISLSFVPSH